MKSAMWNTFSLVYEMKEDGQEITVDFFLCLCQMLQSLSVWRLEWETPRYQEEHMKQCVGVKPTSQLTLKTCETQKVKHSTADHRLNETQGCYAVWMVTTNLNW